MGLLQLPRPGTGRHEAFVLGEGTVPALYLRSCFVGRARSLPRSAHVPPPRGVQWRARGPGEVSGVLSSLLCGAARARASAAEPAGVTARVSGLAPGGCSAPPSAYSPLEGLQGDAFSGRVLAPVFFGNLMWWGFFAFASVLGEGVCRALLLSVQTTTSYADFRVTYS